MTAQEAFKLMMKEQVAPVLRAAGFKGSAPTWRLQSTLGDVVLVNLQRSRWSSADEVDFYVNLAVVPEPWWDFRSHHMLPSGSPAPMEHDGLLRRRLEPHEPLSLGPQPGWVVHDTESAGECGRLLQRQLQTVAIPDLKRLLDREQLIAVIRARAPGWRLAQTPKLAVAYLIADQGPSTSLDEALNIANSLQNDMLTPSAALSAWVTRRASQLRGD